MRSTSGLDATSWLADANFENVATNDDADSTSGRPVRIETDETESEGRAPGRAGARRAHE